MITLTNLSKRFLAVALLIASASCTQETIKPSTETGTDKTQTTSATKLDRDEYRHALTTLNNNDLDKAQRLFNKFIQRKPNLAGAYSNLALIHFKKNEFEKSRIKVNKALKLNPQQVQALNLRAQLYIIDGKIHQAKDDYLKAIQIKPDYGNAQYNLALLYDIYMQDIELAVTHYKIYMSLLEKPDTTTEEWVTQLEGTLNNG